MDDALITLLRRTLEIRAEDVDDDRAEPAEPADTVLPRAERQFRHASRGRTESAGAPALRRRRHRGARWGGAAVAVALVGVGIGGVLAIDRAGRHTGSPATGSSATAAPDPAPAAPPADSTPAAPPSPTATDPADDVAWVLPVRLPPAWQLTDIVAVEHRASARSGPAISDRRHFVRTDPDSGAMTAELIAAVTPAMGGSSSLAVNATVAGHDAEVTGLPARRPDRGELPTVYVRWFDDGLEIGLAGTGLDDEQVLAVAETAELHGETLTIDPEAAGLTGFVPADSSNGGAHDAADDDGDGDDGDGDDGEGGDGGPDADTGARHSVYLTARAADGASSLPILINGTPTNDDLDHYIEISEMPETARRIVNGVEYSVLEWNDEDIGTMTALTWIADGYIYRWSGPFEAAAALQFATLRPASPSEMRIAATEIAERAMELPARAVAQFADGLTVESLGDASTHGPVALCVHTEPPRCQQPTTDSGAGGRGERQIFEVFRVDGQRALIGWVAEDPGDVRGSDGTPAEVVAGAEGWFLRIDIAADAALPRIVSGTGDDALTLFWPDEQIRP